MHTYMLCFHLIVRETNISAFYQTTAPSTLFKHTLSSTISFIKDIGNYKERHPWYECVIVAQVPLFPTRLCNMPDSVRTSPVPGIYCAKLLTIAGEFIRIPWLSALVQAFLLLTRAECSSDLSISCMIDVTRFAREIEHCFVDPNVGKRSNRIHHDSDRLTTSPLDPICSKPVTPKTLLYLIRHSCHHPRFVFWSHIRQFFFFPIQSLLP